MNFPIPESLRTKITTSTAATSSSFSPFQNLDNLAAAHPFTRQIDVLFPSSPRSEALESALSELETQYGRAKVKISDVYEESQKGTFVKGDRYESSLSMLSVGKDTDDVWCIDSRGVLTLSLCKDTYQRVGLTGRALPFKGHTDTHAVNIPLQQKTESVGNRAKRKTGLQALDAHRGDLWDVVYVHSQSETIKFPQGSSQTIKQKTARLSSIHVPSSPILLPPRPQLQQADELEDWTHDMQNLFEWIGMATLHSQRLAANDRVDPYVSLYAPPSPSSIADVTHLQWTGFLIPQFIQKIINEVVLHVKAKTIPFAVITASAFTNSPVAYLSPSPKANKLETPARVPRVDGEDTWCLVVELDSQTKLPRWTMVESVGQWDTRWG